MSFEIGDNSSSIVQRNLAVSNKQIQISMAKLANGEQTKSVENAADLIISEEMETQKSLSHQRSAGTPGHWVYL